MYSGTMHQPSPVEVHNLLRGITFPTTKEHLVDVARHNGASPQVIRMLKTMPGTFFKDGTAVTQAVTEQEMAER